MIEPSSGVGSLRKAARGRDFDFVIAGGGITGCAMASLLVNRRLATAGRVAIIADAAQTAPVAAVAEPDWDLRVFALSRASQRLLSLCGAWQLLPAHKYHPYERMCVWDAHSGTRSGGTESGTPGGTESGTPGATENGTASPERPGAGWLSFDCAELAEPNLGYIVEGRALQSACRSAAIAAGAVFIDGGIREILADQAEVRVRLDDGRLLHARLLIGADGADSAVRNLLGIDTAGHAYHQDALVAHVRTAMSHRNTAWQRFLPTGPLALLPLPDGRSSIVWSTGRQEASRLRSLAAAEFGVELCAASGGILGACEVTTPIASFPLKLQYALDYVRPRAVLVGDAAHAVHPLAGQGLNLGLLDCAVLAEVLENSRGPGHADSRGTGHADPSDPGQWVRFGEHRVLRRYERRRKSDNVLAAAVFDGLERLFSNDSAVLTRLRVAGLGAVGRIPFLKRELATRALGLRGDVPKFLRSDRE